MEVTSTTLYHESILERYSTLNNTFKSGSSSLPQRPQPVALIHKEVHHTSEVRMHPELPDSDATTSTEQNTTSRTTGKSVHKFS